MIDGTFYVAAKFFTQLFTLHGYIGGNYMPLVFCLLPDQLSATYELMLQIIMQECIRMNLVFQPKTVLLDFEQATHSAVRKCIPTAAILGCRFHFAQAVFRKIAALGLKTIYNDAQSPIGQWLRKFFALPL